MYTLTCRGSWAYILKQCMQCGRMCPHCACTIICINTHTHLSKRETIRPAHCSWKAQCTRIYIRCDNSFWTRQKQTGSWLLELIGMVSVSILGLTNSDILHTWQFRHTDPLTIPTHWHLRHHIHSQFHTITTLSWQMFQCVAKGGEIKMMPYA